MDGYSYETTSFVRFRDVDAMQMANHAVIISYLETARTEYMMELMGLESIREIDYLMANVECDYRSPARYGETMRVGVRVSEFGETSFRMAYRVEEAESGRLVAEAQTVQVFFDYEEGSPMSAPAGFRQRVASFDAGDDEREGL